MAPTIPNSFLTALPESVLAQVTEFSEVTLGRAETAFITLQSGLELFAKLQESNAISTEVCVLQALASQRQNGGFQFPVLHQSGNDFFLTQKLTGSALSQELIASLDMTAVAEALLSFHSLDTANIAPQLAEFSLPNSTDFAQTLTACESDVQMALTQKLDSALALINDSEQYLGFIHGDLTADNLQLSEQGQIIVFDWEFASVRDVRWDLACLCEEWALNNSQITELIRAYSEQIELLGDNFQSGLEAWRYVYLVVCFIWAKQERREATYYYNKLLAHL